MLVSGIIIRYKKTVRKFLGLIAQIRFFRCPSYYPNTKSYALTTVLICLNKEVRLTFCILVVALRNNFIIIITHFLCEEPVIVFNNNFPEFFLVCLS